MSLKLPELRLKIKIEERITPPFWVTVLISFLAVIVSLGVTSIFIFQAGVNPLLAYYHILRGAFGSIRGFSETIVVTSPLLLCGLAVSVGFKAQYFTIGAEGQLIAGSIAATAVSLSLGESMPFWVNFPLILLTSFIAGGLLSSISGILKVKFNANEILTTIMMNSIMALFLSYLLHGPWRDPTSGWPYSAFFTPSAQFPTLIAGTRLHVGILIAFLGAFIVYVIFRNMVLGYKIKVVGANPTAAYSQGINVARFFIIASILSGGLAGLAGAGEACGIHNRLTSGVSVGYGYTGVVIALLGRLHPVGVSLAAFFFGALVNGSQTMQMSTGVPAGLIYIIQGVMLIIVISTELLTHYKIKLGE